MEGVDAAAARSYINGSLSETLEATLLNSTKDNTKLNPALEKLKKRFEEKKKGVVSEAENIMDLIAGIITCSVPGALKECDESTGGSIDDVTFRSALLGLVEESVRGILEDEGVVPTGTLQEDMGQLVRLASKKFSIKIFSWIF